MKTDEFLQISRLLGGAFPAMFKGEDVMNTWFNSLNDLDGADTVKAVREYVEEETAYPTIAVIRSRSKAITKQKQALMDNPHSTRTFKCSKCRDQGWTFWTSPTGVEMAEPCTCEAGKKTFYGKSEEEQQRIRAEESRKGVKGAEPMQAPHDFYMEYVFGRKDV